MASSGVSATYINKLNHPMKEIRERALQMLVAKLRLGWELEDELAGTRELLNTLLSWFHTSKPSLQHEALELLLTIVKTKNGTYIATEIGIENIISNLNKIKHKIDPDAIELFNDLEETLRFMNTVDSEININVPHLILHSESSGTNESSGCYYNSGLNKYSSKDTSIFNENVECRKKMSNMDGINVYLFPWVDLSLSDLKTMKLVEDSLKVLKSTRRCCRFIRDVFLCDFPAEIFLNRPSIVKTLIAISDGENGGHPEEALHVLLCITVSLKTRFLKLFSLDLVDKSPKFSDDCKESFDNVNAELEQYAGSSTNIQQDDALIALRQLPAPIYALETMHSVLAILTRSLVLIDVHDNNTSLDMNQLNICLSLVENLIDLLIDCVNEHFWMADHTSHTYRDIAHKSCMVMRMLGELLMKYRKSFQEDHGRTHHRIAYIRLVACGETLLSWAKQSALPPSILITALQTAQIDPTIDLLYQGLGKRIAAVLLTAKSSVDQEYKTKYRELNKLFVSMDYAVQFMKIKDTSRISKNILTCIKNALPILYVHTNEKFLRDIAVILLTKSKDLDFTESDWSIARSIALNLMAHSLEWVQITFYKMLAEMVQSVLMGDNSLQSENEKCLTLVFDVGILTELCCHGLSSNRKDVSGSACDVMLYLLRGRLVLSEGCWWRLLASALPVLPLLHVFAAHDTQLGKAIWKSLEADIVECMGVSQAEMTTGLVRLLFVNCAAVQLDAAHSLCQLLDDIKYLPPRETLRTDILINALRRITPQDFNIDYSSSPSKNPQTSGMIQILDVLKQDLIFNEDTSEYMPRRHIVQPTLEPSLRRSTLQQLALIIRHTDLHDSFMQCDGLNLIIALLRLSLMVDDYLAFPECAISCVSILNSVCFTNRHILAKVPDLPLLLLRVILIFPANESSVLMAAQVLALVAWAGFALQELDANRRRVPALPLSVTERTTLPFAANSYWSTSPNAEHSSIEWLLSDECWRSAIRVRWWWVHDEGYRLLRCAPAASPWGPPASDLQALRALSLPQGCTALLLALENATSHAQVTEALRLLECYTHLVSISAASPKEIGGLPWNHMRRFLSAAPASSRDTALLVSLLQFIIAYMDNVPSDDNTMVWIKSSFIGNDAVIISLLSRERLYPQQTPQEDIEVTQLRVYIVKVLIRCIVMLEKHGEYSCSKMESLIKILLACLERIDLKNFHMLGYLNEAIRCTRYALCSRYCRLSEEMLIQCLKLMTSILSGCASGNGRKGQACRLNAMLSLLVLLRRVHELNIPVQRWAEVWSGGVVRAVVSCSEGEGVELRAAALHVLAALAHHAQLMPQLVQCLPRESLAHHALEIFSREGEANVVRAASAALFTAASSRTSTHSQLLESDALQAMTENNFVEECLHIFVEFCNDKEYENYLEPNIPLSLLERESELEVRVQKSGEFHLSPSLPFIKPPPTATLISAIADVLHNITVLKTAPVQEWNEQGLYRVLFRCVSWCSGSSSEMHRVRLSVCRALFAAATHKCVRTTLATTKDCLYNLLRTLTPIKEDEYDLGSASALAQGLRLLASLLPERSASDAVWWELKENKSTLFHLLLQALETDDNEFQEASMHCLTQLARSMSQKKSSNKSDETCTVLLNNLKSPYLHEYSDKYGAGDSARGDCQPEYMIEEICKVLMNRYRQFTDDKKCLSSREENWTLLSACLSSILCASERARVYCVHRHFQRQLMTTLQVIRDALSLQGKAVDVIRNANSEPSLQTLNWVLILITSSMQECSAAKERIAEDIATTLTRLWPWCMMTEFLRDSVMRLLVTFTNDCSRAWASMCSCVGGRSLLLEVCAVTSREAARPRPSALLPLGLRALRHCASHQHCRSTILKHNELGGSSLLLEVCAVTSCEAMPRFPSALLPLVLRVLRHCARCQHCRSVILKNDALSCICKLRARGNSLSTSAACEEWFRLCEVMSRHPDGATAVLSLVALSTMKPTPVRLLPALANAAHHHRLTFLQSPDLLEVLSASILTGDTAEIVAAARGLWALAANNHRAKLVLRSAGIPSAVQSALQRLQKNSNDTSTRRAIELLTYTQTVLQAI